MTKEQDDSREQNSDNFEEMLEQSMNRSDDFSIGGIVDGKVVHISGGNVFVDILGKSEAVIDIGEFRNNDGTVSVNIGDPIQAYVVSVSGGEIHLTSGIGKGTASTTLMEIAYRESFPVHGTVLSAVKGGYAVSVGGIRCFCPISQIDQRPSADPNALLNKSFLFKIIEIKERGKDIILSRTVLLKERRSQAEDNLKKSLKEGDIVSGSVAGIRDFGIFIDIGGIEALVPKSEISWSRFADLTVFKEGDPVKAAVKSIDWSAKRITLSIKDLSPSPWEHVDKYEVGQTISGQVANIIKNGAFVEIEPGIDGFIPVSRMSLVKKISRPEEAVSPGSRVKAKIISIRRDEKKISLELIPDGPDPWTESGSLTESQTVTVESAEQSGLQVRLANGMRGFIPRRELAIKSESDIQKRYAPGSQIRAAILKMEQEGRKLILSETRALKIEEMNDYENFVKKEASSQSTSLGAIFKDKFKDIQNKMDK
jgi:small subunit ribosomal protein S1